MAHPVETRLKEAGITLPEAAAPAANYVPFVISGGQLFISGQLPMEAGKLAVTGTLGDDLTEDDGIRAARLCAINILAQARAAVGGDWARIARLVKLGGFVASGPGFFRQPAIINGASDLMVAVLGEAGRHARFAVSAPALPLGAAVEIEALFELA